MIFPIGDDNIKGGYKPFVTYTFLAINVAIFLYQLTLGVEGIGHFLNTHGSIPNEIISGDDLYTLLSSMFLHGGISHILFNMLFLWIFADNIEAVIGNAEFILFYILGGLFASAVHIFTDPDSMIPVVGASGAISAVMGTYLVMFPKSKIKMIFLIFFKTFKIPAFLFLGFWFVQQIFSGMGSLGANTAEEAGGVAWWAHIGGFVYGLALGFLFKKLYGSRYNSNDQVL